MTRLSRPLVVLACLGVFALLVAASPAFGGDSTTLIYPTEESIATSGGETVDVTVVVDSDGGYNNTGLASLAVAAEYDTEYLAVDDVETAGWLGGEGVEVTTDTSIDEDAGNITIEQDRDPPKKGVTGNATFATLTFTVQEDAPTGETNITFTHSSAKLVGDYPIYVYDTNATISVQESTPEPDRTDSTLTPESDSDDTLAMGSVAGAAGVFGVGILVMVAIAVFLRRQA